MNENNKATIIVAVIGAVATIGAAIAGNAYGESQQNQYIESQIATVNGDNNNVTINNVDDLVNEYNSLLSENESLKEKNTSYFNDLTDTKEKLESLETQMGDVPQISYNSLGLTIDAQDISINKNNSMVTIDGREYLSKEIAEKLLLDNKNMTIKDETIFVGTVVADKAKLFEQWAVNKKDCSTNFTGNDSFGNARTNAMIFTYYGGNIVYNLDRKYAYLKCTVSISEEYPINSNITLTITPDIGEPYSVQITKTTEPFDIEIPINNCLLLTIDCDANNRSSSVIISDAIVYN